MKLKMHFLSWFVACVACSVQAQNDNSTPEFLKGDSPWADSVMSRLTTEQKIGQLFMVAAYSNRDAAHEAELQKLIKNNAIGGVIFFQGGPGREIEMYNRLQKQSGLPLWVGMDAEWGLGMRLDSTMKFPRQLTLGAIEDDSLIFEMGAEIARQARRVGVHVNFAPVVDINNNPENPVINSRSFGENKLWVTRKSLAYMHGMESENVMANAKHFPGHGDTDTDSHKALPVINHSKERLTQLELYPYTKLIEDGLSSVMVAHLSIPALDSTANRASTLSPEIVTSLLKDEYKFKGLVFTDALNMKGVSSFYEPGEVDLLAAKAGNDVLLFAEDVPKAVAKIKTAIEAGEYSEKSLNESVHKILRAKEWLGLDKDRFVESEGAVEAINSPSALHLKKKLCEAAITVVQNKNEILPLKDLTEKSIAVVNVGGDDTDFYGQLTKHVKAVRFTLPSKPSADQITKLESELKAHNTVILNIEGTNNRPSRNFGLYKAVMAFASKLASNQEVILVHMGNPYALADLKNADLFAAIVIGYQDDSFLSMAAADVLVGSITASGKLPVSIGELFPAQTGLYLSDITRLHYTSPEELGFYSDAFRKVDSIAQLGIDKRAYPGAQILIAKSGQVVYNKTFGHHTYENERPVKSDDLYDLASITKVVASTLSLMKLQDQGLFSLDDPMKKYFPEIPNSSPYATLTSREMLAHVAGLKPWIPFYIETVTNGKPNKDVYASQESADFLRKVARNLYINTESSDSLLLKILNTPLRKNKDYKYSDLGYYFMREIIKRQSGMRVDSFAAANIYAPLGLNTMGYLPLDYFPKDRIIPTEYDTYFRQQLVHGDVHDPGAAMQGGVGGHAGVFSNAEDLAAIMQMLLNGGVYGGEKILNTRTIDEYTACQFCEDELDEKRRGAGFDKPVIPDGPGPTCKCVSFDSFGHSGFTGTIVWADPVEDIVYVFLSNRVYPSAENNKLAKMDIRTNIQEEIYKVLVPMTDTLQVSN